MSLLWQTTRRIFWVNFNKPHRKLGLVFKDGVHIVPRAPKRRKLFIDRKSNRNHLRPFLSAAHRNFANTILSSTKPRHTVSLSQLQWFHTTPRNQIPPVLWAFLKPLGKLWAMLWGRYIRKWWSKIPAEKRAHYKDLFGGMKGIFIGFVAAMAIAVAINYFTHLEENPLTGRIRYISLTPDQLNTIVDFEQKVYLDQYKGKFLSSDSPLWRTVNKCAFQLIDANRGEYKEIEKFDWKVSVVDDIDVNNAFVLPNGHIFVFTGLLNDMDNIDQLSIILGHEISHAVMGHAIEHISRGQVFDVLMIGVLAAIWTFVPGDGIAIVTQWFYGKLMSLMLDLPYSRELETEADEIGLMFAAKACYDVREAPALWAWQHAKKKYSTEESEIPEFLSTHPANEKRTETVKQLVPKALAMRESCSCSKLACPDPWERVTNQINELKSNSNDQKTVPKPSIS